MPVRNTNPSSARTRPIVVIGSINMDMVCRVPHIPVPGETVLGGDVQTIPGGKGANQAVACARLGADVHMIARVGDDDFGQRLLNGLKSHAVHTRYVTLTEGISSGVATITVDDNGENAIVVAPGANHKLSPADIDRAEPLIARAAVVVMQLEVPLETIAHAIALCKRHEVRTILDPAPAPVQPLPPDLFEVSIFTPNQSEAQTIIAAQIAGRDGSKKDRSSAADSKQLGAELIQRGTETAILKLGAEGAMIVARDGQIQTIAGFKVPVVDTTAAGDAFTGALAVAIAEGKDLVQAVRFANAAGALCCTGFGAQPSLPDRDSVDQLL